MSRVLTAFLILALTGCASLSAPKTFLQTDVPAWNDWLNERVDLDLRNVPLADLARRGPFQARSFILAGVDGDAVVSLEAERVTRRRALWLLAEKYGLTLTFADRAGQPVAIHITNRERRRENLPRH